MKYIRTIYGKKIMDVSKLKYVGETDTSYMFCKVYKNGKESKVIKCFTKKVILKTADTIEELCDKWVFDNKFGEKNVIKDIDFCSLETMKRRFDKGLITNVRLAIWTDKGLIFVARMNNKGELKLL